MVVALRGADPSWRRSAVEHGIIPFDPVPGPFIVSKKAPLTEPILRYPSTAVTLLNLGFLQFGKSQTAIGQPNCSIGHCSPTFHVSGGPRIRPVHNPSSVDMAHAILSITARTPLRQAFNLGRWVKLRSPTNHLPPTLPIPSRTPHPCPLKLLR